MNLPSTAIVAIGRNEGERLRACLHSLATTALDVVYVDSGSIDGSLEAALSHGAVVVELDAARPFSAARARQEGLLKALRQWPDLAYVFFVDGDCQVQPGWIDAALSFLEEHPDAAAVAGRRRERFPEQSIYNRLCDFEWDAPVGEAKSVGGDAVYRVAAYLEAGGFDPTVTAGEEPELCARLRRKGWAVCRIDAEMTLHDAAMKKFSQWWKRQVRTGYGGLDVERRFHVGVFDRLLKRAVAWGILLPGCAALGAAIALAFGRERLAALALALECALWALQTARIAAAARRRGLSTRRCLEIGALTMLAKPAIALGVIKGLFTALRGRRATLIEYKGPAMSPLRRPFMSKH